MTLLLINQSDGLGSQLQEEEYSPSDNKLLADNYPLFNVIFHLREMRQPGRTKRTIEYMIAAADKVGRVINRKHKNHKRKNRNS